jgi:hypothetical protein
MDHPCCRVGAIALVLAQMAWAVTSLHETAQPDGEDMTGHRVLAFGAIGLAAVLSGASIRAPSLTMPAATVCLMTTATTGWYASKLNPGSAVSTAGYGASLFSTAACLLLLTADMAGEPPPPPAGVLVVAPMDVPAPPMEFSGWGFVDDDDDALFSLDRA